MKKINLKLFYENSIIFTFIIILLLATNFSISNYKNIKQLVNIRINKQYIYNFAIILNILILFNYSSIIYQKFIKK